MSPAIKSKLKPWQPSIVEATCDGLSKGNFLNASGLGSGKQFMACASAIEHGMKIVAICRQAAISTWQECWVGHFGMPSTDCYAINREALRTGKHPLLELDFGEWNHATGKRKKVWKWKLPANTMLIVDEVHWDAGQSTINSEILRAAVKQGIKIQMLSGTAADDPRKMRAIGYALGLHDDFDFPGWLSLHGATIDSWTYALPIRFLESAAGKADLVKRRKATMQSIHAQLTKAGRMVRMPTSAIPNFPKKIVEPRCIKFSSDELSHIYEEMREEFRALGQRGIGGKGLTAMIPKLQRAEMLMVPEICEEVEEIIEEGASAVVFTNFIGTVNALAKRLKTDCLFTGAQSMVEKDENRKRFRDDLERKIIVNAGAGSESVSFADERGEFPRVGLILPSFQAIQLNQLLGRLARASSLSTSIYRILFPKGTFLENAYNACKRRTELYSAFNGDVEFSDDDVQAGLFN